MPVALLDVNVLLALAWPNHICHRAARKWFSAHRLDGWATCTLTQLGFVRLSSLEAVTKRPVTVQEAMRALATATTAPEHVFWGMDSSLVHIHPEIGARLMGHRQLVDALLLDLAIRNGGKLVTFDRRVENLLPADSPHRDALEILPIDD
ncbi:MAG: PIN domain-containing protein [Bryobacterales bacterium]|nr:PIN domain-containing protein [Bryobacteraceae bacterium]MDW8355935.1 PIN domain-containing protein [Bryobacterales bacterium]